jgi:hypothetical protein
MPVKIARAEQSAPLRICDWNTIFENSRTRQVDALNWVRLPVKSDSDGYTRFIEMDDPLKSLALFGAWTALVKVAARCKPRGVLVRDGATPLTASDLARRANMGADFAPFFAEMMERAKRVGWLVSLTREEVERLRKGESLELDDIGGDLDDGGGAAAETSGDGQSGVKRASPGRQSGDVQNVSRASPGRQSGDVQNVSRASPGRHSGVSQVTPEHSPASGNGALTREQFDQIWGLFPKSRRLDRERCFGLVAAHVKAGRKVAALREATGRYAQAVKDAGTPPKFIQLAKTFFGPQGRVLDALEADFVEQYVAGNKGGDEQPKVKFKPGTLWGVVFGEVCKISKHPHSGRMEYYSHGDWHELPGNVEVQKA